MPVKKNTTTKAITKKELIKAYGISDKTFRGWCKRANIHLERNSAPLTPKQVREVFEAFDPPENFI